MGERRAGRENALQMLYQVDMGGGDLRQVLSTFWMGKNPSHEMRVFAERLVTGTVNNLQQIDSHLRSGLEHWRLPRIAAVDRSVLRLAVFEFLFEPETPHIVIINEAVELVKKFGGADSSQFVNGVLDAVRKRLELLPESKDMAGETPPS